MNQPRFNVNTLKNVFLTLFVMSFAVLAVLVTVLPRGGALPPPPTPTEDPTQPDPPTAHPGTGTQTESQSSAIGLSTLIGTAITTITSFAGFLVTTIITWRKEKRESALADLERMKKELELEKSKLELEQMKNKPKKKKQ